MLTRRKKVILALIAGTLSGLLVATAYAAEFIWPNLNTSVTATDYWGYSGGGSVHAYGQTFKTLNKNVHSVAFKLNRQCNDSCVTTNNRQLTIDILEGATCSSGTVAATYTMSATDVIANFPYHTDSTYAIPVYGTLTPGSTYCARLTVSTYTGGTFMAIEDVDGSAYTPGTARRSNNSDVWSDVSGLDAWFQLSGEYGGPVYSPEITATINSPGPYDILRTSDLADGLVVSGYSSVDSATDTTNSTTFDWLLSEQGTDWAEIDSATSNTLSGTLRASIETLDGFDGPSGQYELFLRACYDGACSPIASTFLNVAEVATSTGITGSTNPIIATTDPFPSADYGACGATNLGDCFTGFFSWIGNVLRWLFLPPSITAFDPSPLFSMFETRWPFAYIFGPITTWKTGYDSGGSCPIPTLLGSTIMGHTMPTFDLCGTLDGIGTALDGNAFGYTTMVWAIYLGALFMVWRSAEGIHKGHKK